MSGVGMTLVSVSPSGFARSLGQGGRDCAIIGRRLDGKGTYDVSRSSHFLEGPSLTPGVVAFVGLFCTAYSS